MADLTAELLAQVRDAGAGGRRLDIRGRASKPWTRRRVAGEVLSLADHSGIISYDPTELVVTVRAGTALAELEQALAEQGQMLAMESPDFNGGSSIGGVVALGWSGARSVFAGGVRDAVLGVRMVNGLGEDLKFGGQVMKNVAGFDISRLMVGSLGGLGALLELSLKVIPRPAQELSLQFAQPNLAACRSAVADWLRLGLPLSAACFDNGQFKARFSGPGALLEDIRGKIGGEPLDDKFWGELQRLQLPLFHHGWGDDKLFDCNGEVCWSAHTRRRGDGEIVDLNTGPRQPPATDGQGKLQARVRSAFDPQAVFRTEEVA